MLRSIAPPKTLLVFFIFKVSANQRSISATSIAIIKVFSVIIKPPLLIILYTIYLKNQAILYNFTIFENIVKSR